MAEHKAPRTTWAPHDEHGKLSTAERDHLPESVFAFPKQRKEPLTDASHVRNALARFDQAVAALCARADERRVRMESRVAAEIPAQRDGVRVQQAEDAAAHAAEAEQEPEPDAAGDSVASA